MLTSGQTIVLVEDGMFCIHVQEVKIRTEIGVKAHIYKQLTCIIVYGEILGSGLDWTWKKNR